MARNSSAGVNDSVKNIYIYIYINCNGTDPIPMDQYQADSGRNAGSDVRDKKKIRRIRFDPVRTLQFRIIRILSVFK